MTFEQKKAPGAHTEGFPQINNNHQQITDTTSLTGPTISPERFERELNGVYIVVAQINSKSPEPRFRKYFYVNLPAAQRRVFNARAEGRYASITLARLQVVPGGLNALNLDGGGDE